MQRCEKKEQGSFVVPDSNEKDWEFRIYSEELTRIIWRRMGWEKDFSYRCLGVSYPKYNLAEFDLNTAEPITDTESDKE